MLSPAFAYDAVYPALYSVYVISTVASCM